MAAEVDRAGVASRQNPAVVDLDAQNGVQAPENRGGRLGEKIYHADTMIPWVNRLNEDNRRIFRTTGGHTASQRTV
jgi:hypothetical protein